MGCEPSVKGLNQSQSISTSVPGSKEDGWMKHLERTTVLKGFNRNVQEEGFPNDLEE